LPSSKDKHFSSVADLKKIAIPELAAMPMLTTCAVSGFKSLIMFAAVNLCDAVVPGSSELVGGLIEAVVDDAGDRFHQRLEQSSIGPPYWEQGRAVCNSCNTSITRGCVSHCVTCGDFDLCASCMTDRMEISPQFHDASHKWTIYMLSKSMRGYANLDNTPSLAERPSTAVGTSGGKFYCTGYYMQEGTRTAQTIEVVLSGRDGATLSGGGHDAIGTFTIQGEKRNGDCVSFQKRYATHTVAYEGVLVDGAMLVGTWTIRGDDAGPFVLVFERGDVPTEAAEKATWSGYYVQYQRRYNTSFVLTIASSGRIEGGGRDDVGEFKLRGRFLDGSTTGSFLFTKKYASHAISYEGVRTGSMMQGTYQSPDVGTDAFFLQKMTTGS
jgi:hypothetical protein